MERAPEVKKYIDPMVDFGFKKIFKESKNKQLIIRPLNAIFGLDIIDIKILDSEQLGPTRKDRKAYYDMHCTDSSGQTFIIEVQLAEQDFFMERAIFYSSTTITDKAVRGEWDYHVYPVFFLGLMNFDMRHLDPDLARPDQFIHKFTLREESTHERMSDALRFAFLEVARFDKKKEDCHSFEDRFLYIMKNLPTFAEKPELWDDPYFEDIMTEAEYANMDRHERAAYIRSMKDKWDNYAIMKTATRKGLEQGLEQGLKQGLEQGLEQGREEERVAMARRMKADHIPAETIAKYSGLTEDQIKAL